MSYNTPKPDRCKSRLYLYLDDTGGSYHFLTCTEPAAHNGECKTSVPFDYLCELLKVKKYLKIAKTETVQPRWYWERSRYQCVPLCHPERREEDSCSWSYTVRKMEGSPIAADLCLPCADALIKVLNAPT